MTPAELKIEIYRILDRVPENMLAHIFEYLKDLQHNSVKSSELAKTVSALIEQDRKLLQKVAK